MIMAAMAQVTASGADINLKWKVGDSTGEGDNRYNHLTLVNNSARHLEAPWSVYYSSQAWGQLHPVTPGYTTERILGTLFRLTAQNSPIAPGDSVNIVLSGPYIHQRSFFPENPYLVTVSDSVMRIDFSYREAPHREMAATISGYPDGRYFYELNSLIGNAPESGVYDIIPAMKEVTADTVGAPCVIDGAVTIEAPDAFATEARLLTDALIRQGIGVTAGATPVRLAEDKSVTEPEGYTIDIMPGSIAIGASTPEGIWRGCTSLLSVVLGRRMPHPLPAAHISDAPSLGYRGLHFDVARNFSSKEDVMKLIDYMTLYKLNKLHFHLVDDEGWRLAIDGLDELTDIGSRRLHGDETRALPPLYGSGADGSTTGNGYFTRRDFTDILRYAAPRRVERPSDWGTDLSAGKVALDTDSRQNIRGIQGQLWAETYRSFDMVEERMLPKMLGLAERAWNPEPAWATGGYDDFRDAASRYTARIGDRETARLARLGARFHVPAPGLTLDADGRLLANSAYRDASIHYTLDGTDPTTQSPRWTAPVALPASATEVRAIAIINGRSSHIAELFLPLAK